MSRVSKTAPSNSGSSPKKGSKPAAKADDSALTTPPVKTDAELYSEYLSGIEPDLNFPKDELDDWEPPINWELEGPPDEEHEMSPEWEDIAASDATTALSPTAPDSNENLNAQLDSFAAHALNGLLAGMLSIPNTALDTAEIARMAYNYAEAMLRERQRRLDNQAPSPSPLPNTEKPDFAF